MEKEFVLSDEERKLAIDMNINPDMPEFISFKKECFEMSHKMALKICEKSGLDYEYVVKELNNINPTSDFESPIWKYL